MHPAISESSISLSVPQTEEGKPPAFLLNQVFQFILRCFSFFFRPALQELLPLSRLFWDFSAFAGETVFMLRGGLLTRELTFLFTDSRNRKQFQQLSVTLFRVISQSYVV